MNKITSQLFDEVLGLLAEACLWGLLAIAAIVLLPVWAIGAVAEYIVRPQGGR